MVSDANINFTEQVTFSEKKCCSVHFRNSPKEWCLIFSCVYRSFSLSRNKN